MSDSSSPPRLRGSRVGRSGERSRRSPDAPVLTDGGSRRPRAIAVLRALACGTALLAVLWETFYLFLPERLLEFPTWFWPYAQPWWWPFKPQTFTWRPAPLALALAADGLLVGIAAFPTKLRLRWTIATILFASFCLHAAIVALPERGLAAYARRIAGSAHLEFSIRAALNPHLVDTLVAYEDHLIDGLPSTFSRVKGPANLGFYVALHRVAQLPGVADLLDRAIAAEPGLAREVRQLVRNRVSPFPEIPVRMLHEIVRTLVLTPIVSWFIASMLPLPTFLLGFALFRRLDISVLLAIFSVAVPAIVVENAQLDGNVFPLLFVMGLALFAYGWQGQRWPVLVLAAALSALYLYFTFGGATLIALCAIFAVVDMLVPPRANRRIAGLALYGLGVTVTLLLLHLTLSFHILNRYLDARSLQAMWREGPDSWQWFVLNSTEFFLALGPVFTSLSIIGGVASLYSLPYCSPPQKFSIALALTFILLAALGSNSEVYRLWAFFGLAFTAPSALGVYFLGGRRATLLGTIAVATHLLWLLPFASHYGHLPR